MITNVCALQSCAVVIVRFVSFYVFIVGYLVFVHSLLVIQCMELVTRCDTCVSIAPTSMRI